MLAWNTIKYFTSRQIEVTINNAVHYNIRVIDCDVTIADCDSDVTITNFFSAVFVEISMAFRMIKTRNKTLFLQNKCGGNTIKRPHM